MNLGHFCTVANIRFNLIYLYDLGCSQFSISRNNAININIAIHILLFSFLQWLSKWDCLITKNRYFSSLIPQTLLDFKRGSIYFAPEMHKNTYFPKSSPALYYCLYKFCHCDGRREMLFHFIYIFFLLVSVSIISYAYYQPRAFLLSENCLLTPFLGNMSVFLINLEWTFGVCM